MPATPGRRTIVTLDTPVSKGTQQPWFHDLSYRKISDGQPPDSTDVAYFEGIGWQAAEYQATLSALHETSTADDAVLPMTFAGGFLSSPSQRTPSELPGIGATLTRSSGDDLHQKRVGAGEDWDTFLSADDTAFDRPEPSLDNVRMDRIAVGTSNHNPNEAIWIRFYVPGTRGRASVQRVGRVYFSGIPTYDVADLAPGTGQYALTLNGDGICNLHERREPIGEQVIGDWVWRAKFRWSPPAMVSGAQHVIVIRSDAYLDSEGKWRGSRILFEFQSFTGVIGAALAAVSGMIAHPVSTYVTTQLSYVAPTLQPVRVDIRRTVRAELQLSKSKYRTTSVLRTVTVASPTPLYDPADGDQIPIDVWFCGNLPSGTSISAIELYSLSGEDGESATPCPTVGDLQTDGATWYHQSFEIAPGKRFYYAIVTYHATSFTTPNLNRFVISRRGHVRASEPTPVVPETVTRVSITGQSADITHETASFEITDFSGDLDRLRHRAEMPIRAEVRYGDGDDDVSVIFSGRIIKAKRRIRGGARTGTRGGGVDLSSYPVARWGRYSLTCVGDWYTLMLAKAMQVYDFSGPDPTDGIAPHKASTALKVLFYLANIPDSRIDVPDSPIRLFTGEGNGSELRVEPFTPIGPLIVEWARNYLGAYLTKDNNASFGADPEDKLGMWRVLIPPRPPYTVLCNFKFFPDDPDSGKYEITAPGAYPPINDGVTLQTFIRKFSYTDEVEAPEGNILVVTGTGYVDASLAKGSQQLTQVVINYPAVDVDQEEPLPLPDPTHPDYTDGQPKLIYYADPALHTQAAVDFVARRLFDMAMHAKKIVCFEAPLVLVTDPNDAYQCRKRPLRFGDIVTIEGELFYASSVNPSFASGGGKNQMAAYELINVPALANPEEEEEDQMFLSILGVIS